jgi:biotin operon repressor
MYTTGYRRRLEVDYVSIKEILLVYLKRNHKGKEKAVQSRGLENKFQVSSRNIRNIVNELRCEGYPICSDENGYYYAAKKEEILKSIYQLDSRMCKIAEAKNGLVNSLAFFSDSSSQLQLELWIVHEKEVSDY